MPRGVHHEHVVKSESDLERVWVSVDDEGNELDEHRIEILTDTPDPPLAALPDAVLTVRHRPHRLGLLYAMVAGMVGAGIVEIAVHFGR